MFAEDDLKRVCVNTMSCGVYFWQTLFSFTAPTGGLYKMIEEHNSDETFQKTNDMLVPVKCDHAEIECIINIVM